jgi:hypothetical protein
MAMTGNDGRTPDGRPKDAVDLAALELQMSRADQWVAGADERERLADERERLSDEREALADERERLADRHDHLLDRREVDGHAPSSPEEDDGGADVVATQAALHRAQEWMRRAEAQVLRARQAAARAQARASRRAAGTARAGAAAEQARQTSGLDERVWLADRRDFVAAERSDLADERETVADQRDATADLRERIADRRENDALNRDRLIDEQHRDLGGAFARLVTSDGAPYADLRNKARQGRESAAVSRRGAAVDRAGAAASTGPEIYGTMLLASFAQLAQQLFGSDDLSDALPRVLKHIVAVVAGCDWASVTLLRREGVTDTVASSALAAELDELQFGTGIGPSIEALRSEKPVYVCSLGDSPRWPVLAATATQLGVSSALCHGLFIHHAAQWSAQGTLNLYSASSDAFSDDDHEFASILAAFVAAATAIAQRRDDVERREAALHRGLSTRDVIGQAKGILMERQHLSPGDAFDLLRRASQRLNHKLAEVAQHLADTGELPE